MVVEASINIAQTEVSLPTYSYRLAILISICRCDLQLAKSALTCDYVENLVPSCVKHATTSYQYSGHMCYACTSTSFPKITSYVMLTVVSSRRSRARSGQGRLHQQRHPRRRQTQKRQTIPSWNAGQESTMSRGSDRMRDDWNFLAGWKASQVARLYRHAERY